MRSSEPDRAEPGGYSERLSVPWWWWPAGLAVGGLLAGQIHGGYAGVRSWLPYVALGLVTVGLLVWLGSGRVRVDRTGIIAGHQRLGHDEVATVEELDQVHTRNALGRDADPTGLVFQRPWVHTSVRVITRTDDPPYLLVSTRRPDRLAAAIVRHARLVAPPDEPPPDGVAPRNRGVPPH